MSSARPPVQQQESLSSIRFAGRSFVVASNIPPEQLRGLEREIEARGGTVHPFLNAVTDVLVVGTTEGAESHAHWAREQVRRGEIYRSRWGHLRFVSEEELRATLDAERAAAG